MNGDNGTSAPHNQQLRALLFTDLCDSLLLVERIGDVAAAELFQEHDRLVLALQQRWNGQLIDRSDGLFMLFERAVDALGFALDYQVDPLRQGIAESWPDSLDCSAARDEWGFAPRYDLDAMTRDMLERVAAKLRPAA